MNNIKLPFNPLNLDIEPLDIYIGKKSSKNTKKINKEKDRLIIICIQLEEIINRLKFIINEIKNENF